MQKKKFTNWVIVKTVSIHPYIFAVVPNHPNANKHGYVLLHRVLMENKLKRLLRPYEVVHHVDENTKNNNSSNLKVMTNADHNREHGRLKGRKYAELKCPTCKRIFYKRTKTIRINKGSERHLTFCSEKCSRVFNRKNKEKVKQAKETNILNIYRIFSNGKKKLLSEWEEEQQQKKQQRAASKKGRKPKKINLCIDCSTHIENTSIRCKKCNGKIAGPKRQKIQWPDLKTLQNMVQSNGFSYTGRILGVSDNAVRKHILKYVIQRL